jgi:hypothetical protein
MDKLRCPNPPGTFAMRFSLALFVLICAAILPACASPQRHQVVVALDEALSRASSRPTIQVDIVGLTDAERRAWDELPLSSYWLPGSEVRKAHGDRTVSFRFSAERSQLFVIPADSEIWSTWHKAGARWLYVVANLPGGIEDQVGAADPRRLAILLSSKEWEADAPLQIQVRRDAVVFMTPRTQPAAAKKD